MNLVELNPGQMRDRVQLTRVGGIATYTGGSDMGIVGILAANIISKTIFSGCSRPAGILPFLMCAELPLRVSI
jgi:hypothetical protein